MYVYIVPATPKLEPRNPNLYPPHTPHLRARTRFGFALRTLTGSTETMRSRNMNRDGDEQGGTWGMFWSAVPSTVLGFSEPRSSLFGHGIPSSHVHFFHSWLYITFWTLGPLRLLSI
ncbi:hypothetical protein Hypma_003030 [Hypsizygus marmoreus]|uniref:Uncharacterized protein n=1 Tax=Hypsizygus marmoreus TaxID=39966 RepID=A0A369J7B7_HYPMA|nr:hypothetical protein Hypma_003030 [Hypsizygus marmoreus]